MTSVQDDAGAGLVEGWIKAWRGFGWTRWDLGLQAVATSGEHYDYVLFITDGWPTDDHGSTVTDTSTPNKDAVVSAANAVKAEGTRIIVIYAATGSQTLNAEQRANVVSISGPTHDQNVLVNDYYEVGWDAVAQQFQTLANMCTLPVTVDATRTIHYVDENNNPIPGVDDKVQTVSYVKTTDLNTNNVTYDPPLDTLFFDSVTSPVVAGYTPDQSSVAREAVPVTADPPNLEETVTYTRNVVDFTNSSWTVVPKTSVAGETVPYANGNSTRSDYWTATLTAKNQFGVAMDDLDTSLISFSVDPSASVTISPVTNNHDGTYSVTIASTKAGDYTASLKYNGQPVGDPKTISFQPGAFSYDKSTFDVSPVATTDKSTWVTVSDGTGDNYYTATLTAKDDNDNPLTDLNTADITFSANPSAKVIITDVVNNHDGTYTVHYSSTLADTTSPTKMAQVAYKDPTTGVLTAVGTPKPIPFKAGDDSVGPFICDEGQVGTNLSVDNNSLSVGDTSHATALVTDQYCNVKEGVDVTFSLDPALSGGLSKTTAKTNEHGEAYADVTDNVAETVTLHAAITAGTVEPAQDITFTEGDLDTGTSIFEVHMTDPDATAVVADGTQSWTGTLTARDGKNNLLSDLDPDNMAFTVSSADVTVSSVAKKGNGVYEVTYTTTTAGDYTAALTYKNDNGNDNKVGTDEPISFVADSIDPDSSVTVSPRSQVVGSQVTVTIVAKDGNGNPILGLTSNDFVVTGTADGLPDLTISTCIPSGDGVYTCQATSQIVGDFTVQATVKGTGLNQKPPVTFYAGGVCTTNPTLAPGNEDNITRFEPVVQKSLANGSDKDSAKAYAYDCFGNPVPGAEVIVNDVSTGDLAGYLHPVEQSTTTDPDGTAMIYWTSTKAGTFTAVGTIGGLPPLTGTMNWIQFTNGLGDPDNSELVVTPDSPIVVGNSYTATVTVRDAHNNLVPDENVSFSLDPGSPASLSKPFCTTRSDGTCEVTVTSKLVTTVAIHATLLKDGQDTDLGGNGTVNDSPQTVSFTAGEVCVTNCTPVDPSHVTRVEVTKDGQTADGQTADVATAYAYDALGNPKQGITVVSSTLDSALSNQPIAKTNDDGTTVINYTSTAAGAHVATVTIDSKTPTEAINSDKTTNTNGQITLNFSSGTASAKDSSLTIDPTVSQQVNSTFTVTAHVVDTNKNPVSGAVVTFPPVTNLTFDKTSCTSEADGTCEVTVTSRLVGTYTVSAKLGDDALKNTVDAAFTAGPACVPTVDVCNPVNPDNVTRVKVTTDGRLADGQEKDVATVWVYDKDGNPVKDVVVQSAPATGETALTVQPNVAKTNTDGITTIWYTSTVMGEHNADVTIDGKTPEKTPITVSFGSGNGAADHSSWVVTPASPLTVGTSADSTYTATATVNDKNDNPVKDATVTFTISPSGNPVFTDGNTCQTDENGQCSVSVYSTKAGTYSMGAGITAGPIKNADSNQVSASVAWKADSVCSKAAGCDPVDPNLAPELRTRVEITTDDKAADGVEHDVVTVWAFDQWGNAVEGAVVQSTTNDTALTVETGINPIKANGSSTIWYASTVADKHPASVLVGQTIVDPQVELTFVSGDLDPAHSTFTVYPTGSSPVVADGVQSWTGKLTAGDKNGNPLSDLDVDNMAFTVAPDGVTVSNVHNDGSGVYTVTYTSLTSGDFTAALTYKDPTNKVGSDETISFVSGPVDDKYSTVSLDRDRQVAGSSVTVIVTAKDVNGNPVLGLTASDIAVVGTGVDTTAGLPNLTITNFANPSDGVYTYQAMSKLIGEFEVRATVTDTLLSEAPHVTFYSGGVCVNGATPVNPDNVTRFEPVKNYSVANGSDQDSAMAYAYDCLGNPVEGAAVVARDVSTGELAGYLRPVEQSVTTDPDGTAMIYWTSTKAGIFTADGTIAGLRPPETGVMNWITFNSGLGDPAKSELVVSPASPIVVENSYTATVTVRDTNGNFVKDENVAFYLDPSSPATLSATTCSTDANGTCWVRVSSDLVTTVAIHATLPKDGQSVDLTGNGTVNASPQTVEFIAGDVCVTNCHPVDPTHVTRVEVTHDGAEANGGALDVATAYAYDNKGNPKKDVIVSSSTTDSALGTQAIAKTGADGTTVINYTSTVAGAHVATVVIDSKVPTQAVSYDKTVTTNGQITLNFGSGTASLDDSFLTINPTTSQQVNSTFTVTAHVLDTNKNPVSGTVVTFPAVTNLTFDKASCLSEADGTCQVNVTSRLMGTYTVRGQLDMQDLPNTVDAVFTAGPVCVVTETTVCDPVNTDNYSRVEVTTNGKKADGQEKDAATVYAYDYDGNPVQGVVVQSAPVLSETSLTVQSNVELTGADGTTTIWYTSTVIGPHDADVTIGGKTPETSPVTVSFGSGDGAADHSSWVVTPASPLTVGTSADSTYTATATVNDKNDNPVKDAIVTFTITPSGNPVFTDAKNTCQTNAQGKCSVSVSSTKSGTYSLGAEITSGAIINADTHNVSAPVAWKADSVCSQAENCEPVNPLPDELHTRVEIVDNEMAADGVARDTVRVWAFDKWGNAVEGALVQSVAQDSAMTVQPGISPINKDGSSTIWYTSTVAGDHTAPVLVDGVRPVNAPVTLTFVSGDLNTDNSTFEVYPTGSSPVVADGAQSWTGKLVARDGKNNLLSNLDTTNMAFTVAPDGVTVSNVHNDGSGVYTVTYTSLTSGDFTAALTYKDPTNKVGSDETISFVSGGVDDKYSTVSLDRDRQVAGSSVTVIVTAKDVNGNPVLGLTASDIAVVGTGVDTTASLPNLTISGFANPSDGVYTYQAMSKLIGEFEVRATVTDTLLSGAPHVTFYSGGVCVNGATPVNPDNVTRFAPVKQYGVADGRDQDSARAYAYDCLGNPVEGATVSVVDQSTGDLAGYLRPESQSVTTGSNGTAMIYWTSTKAGIFTAEGLINDLRPATGVMNWITFNSGLGDPTKSELVVSPASPIVVQNSYTATVTVRDTNGNAVPNENVSFSLDPSSPATLNATTCSTDANGTCSVRVSSDLVTTVAIHATLPKDGQNVDLTGNGTVNASPQTVSFIAGDVCVTNCHPVDPTHVTRVEVTYDGAEANGGALDIATVYAYDATGNPTSGKTVTSSTTDSALGIQVVGTTGADGTAEIDYKSTIAGPHMAFVIVDSKVPAKATSSDGDRTDGRITLNFGSGTASAADSYLTISPTTSQQVNSTFTVTAHVLDTNKNAVSGTVVTFPAVTNLTFDKASCLSEADGTCQVNVTSRLVGTYNVSAKLNMQNVSNTVDATFTAGPVCVVTETTVCDPVNTDNYSRVEVTTNGRTADGLDKDAATVYAYDYDGNPVQGVLVQSAPAADETALTVQPNVTPTNAAGMTTIWYTSTVKGGHWADVFIDNKTPETSPIQVTFGSGNGAQENSSWVVAPKGPLTVGQSSDSTYTATATVKDKNNNPVQDATVVFGIDPSSAPQFTDGNTCQTDGQGVCSVSVSSTKSGTYSMTASISSGPIKNTTTNEVSAPVAWTADSVCSKAAGCDPVDPTLPDELRTTVDITVNNQAADGTTQDIVTVKAFDKWGNPVEGALVQSTSGNAAMTVQSGISAINKNGSSTIWYTSMVAGTYSASILVDGKQAVDPQVQLTFVAGPVCVVEAGCVPVGPGTDPSRQTRVAVSLNDQAVNGSDIVTVYAFDKTGNVVPGVQFQIRTDDTTLSFVGGNRTAMVASGENNTVAATSTTGGSHAATALVDGVELTRHGSPLDLRFIAAPTITSPKNGDLSNDKPITITGTGQNPGDRVVVSEGGNKVCETVVQANLTWSCAASLEDGSHTLVAVETNSGNVDSPQSTPVTVTIDATPPKAPEVAPSNGSEVTGTADPGTKVTVTDEDNKPVEGCVDVPVDEDGNFSCTPVTPIPPNTTVKVTAEDEAGNVSAPTPLDVVALRVVITYETRQPGQDQVVSGYNFNPGEQVCLFFGETKMSCANADEKGTVTFTFTVPASTPAGTQTVTLTGATSGSVSGSFGITAIQVKTGGTAHRSGAPWALAVGCLLAAAGVWGVTRKVAATKK